MSGHDDTCVLLNAQRRRADPRAMSTYPKCPKFEATGFEFAEPVMDPLANCSSPPLPPERIFDPSVDLILVEGLATRRSHDEEPDMTPPPPGPCYRPVRGEVGPDVG
jgi:hypothetical protein